MHRRGCVSLQYRYLGLLFAIPGARKRDAVESLIVKLAAEEQGFGKGFISGSLMNFRAILNIAGPYLFGQVRIPLYATHRAQCMEFKFLILWGFYGDYRRTRSARSATSPVWRLWRRPGPLAWPSWCSAHSRAKT